MKKKRGEILPLRFSRRSGRKSHLPPLLPRLSGHPSELNNLDVAPPSSSGALVGASPNISSGQASEVMVMRFKAEEVPLRREVEAALKSSALMADQCTSLHTVRNIFKFLNYGVMDLLLSFVKGKEVRISIFF